MSAKNIITRLREEGVLYWYFDTRAQGDSNSPGYAGYNGKMAQRYTDSSGTPSENNDYAYVVAAAKPDPPSTYPQPTTSGVDFDQHQYLVVDQATSNPPSDEFTVVVLVDDMQFENDDNVNAHPNRHECAVLINRSSAVLT